MSLADVLGQEGAVATLRRAIDEGRAHHAYRFEGPDGTGKELAAFGFAQALVCTEGRGCGKCNACRRAVTFSTSEPHVPLHPDVILLQRGLYADVLRAETGKKLEEKMGISVDQVRQVVLAQVGFTPAEGRARIFIIRDAHDMTPNAANALLKTLEEPRPATHFVLLTSRPDKLLPTIRSRTMPIRFAPLAPDILRTILSSKGVAADVIEDAIALGEGSVSAALENVDEEMVARRKAFIEGALKAAASRNPARAVSFAEKADVDRTNAKQELLGFAAHLDRTARRIAATDPAGAGAIARGYQAVLATITDFEQANAAPILAYSKLLITLGRNGAARAALRDLPEK
ncbi:MAG: DNA polymerase III subunit [Polyangiaceae bacterium]|nr:DNA polymerase III subunit [Polyangiaceae bacterium]